MRKLHEMVVAHGLEQRVDLMMDGGLNAANVVWFVQAGMTVGEFSSPLLEGPQGKFAPGTGEIVPGCTSECARLWTERVTCIARMRGLVSQHPRQVIFELSAGFYLVGIFV